MSVEGMYAPESGIEWLWKHILWERVAMEWKFRGDGSETGWRRVGTDIISALTVIDGWGLV